MNGKERKYIDIPISGNSKSGDYIKNNDALDNALRMWISSSKDEYLRRSGGNWLLKHIGKQMNDSRALDIRRTIQLGLETDFQPTLKILELTVTPDYSKKKWVIVLVAYSEAFRVGLNQTYLVDNEG